MIIIYMPAYKAELYTYNCLMINDRRLIYSLTSSKTGYSYNIIISNNNNMQYALGVVCLFISKGLYTL